MSNSLTDTIPLLKRNFSGETITKLYYAKRNVITEEMKYVAEEENEDREVIRGEIGRGRLIILSNINHISLIPNGMG